MAWFAIEHLEADGTWQFKRGATSRNIRTLIDMLTDPVKGPYRGCEDNFWWRIKPSSEDEVKTIESYLKGETL